MTDKHPIHPPTELLQELWDRLRKSPDSSVDAAIAWTEAVALAAQWGADQELEACCHQLRLQGFDLVDDLRVTRRPKPPSLKEQALAALAAADGADHPVVATVLTADQHAIIRRALEQLDD